MPVDAEHLQYIYNRLWVFFVDHHLLGPPALVTGVVVSLIAGEALFRDWKKTTAYRLFVRRSTSAKIDLVYYLLQFTGVVTLLEIVLSFGIAIGGNRLANATVDNLNWARITLPADGILEIAFSFVVYWIVTGFFGYWIHRMYHWPLFWSVHRFHHAAPELNFLTAHRVHPLESFLRVFNFLSPVVILNIPDSVMLVGLFAGNFVNFCQHSELPWSWGWVGRWIFASPLVHQLHHSTDPEHRDSNFSNCPLWDHVFGTWYDGAKRPTEYGIDDIGYDERPLRQLAYDTWTFYGKLGLALCYPVRRVTSLWERPPEPEPRPSDATAGR
jgi:sterol desaturase/sphingolipid hydroxylase (fatty acid hydroxylase superfamily)